MELPRVKDDALSISECNCLILRTIKGKKHVKI